MARIVILNGPGSVGKSSVARHLQAMVIPPMLHVAMDTFLEMLPEELQDHPDGVHYLPGEVGVQVRLGLAGQRLMLGMREAVLALANAGNDLILDIVLPAAGLEAYRARLSGHRLLCVGLDATLAVLEAREAARGDRMRGLARDQVGWVHAGQDYDLQLDTGGLSLQDCAVRIAEAMQEPAP